MTGMDPESSPGPQRGGSVVPGLEPQWLVRLRHAVHIDFAPRHRPPSLLSLAVATVVSVVGSLGFDEACVHLATAIDPALGSYPHYQFSDYATLTVIGVVVACAGWPVVSFVSSTPRWVFLRSAVAVTVVLWLPDVWLLLQGQPPKAVAVLMVMHLGIALVTYNVLVHVARLRPSLRMVTEPYRLALTERMVRRLWSSMAILVAAELALGVVTIVSVPFKRPNTVLPTRATALYAAHGAVGIALGVGALLALVLSSVTGRMARIGAVMGAVGVAIGLAGGLCATFQTTRLLGMAAMMVGVVVAGVGYMVPSLEAMGKAEAARAAAAREALAQTRPPTGTASGARDKERDPQTSVNGHGDFEAPPR